jgi:hypothetical protein
MTGGSWEPGAVVVWWEYRTGWENWTPDPSWAVPDELPADWRPPD